ncbi:MAG: hypothetical protein H8E57_05155 [Candidatus Cloacimonetes bacterium]|nr:hypothetical protein [Candidatus Cloacimonadota bacterium]
MPVTKMKSKWSSGNLVFYGDGDINFGVDDDGVDVKFFGATASAYMLWDESADTLIFDKADIKLGDTDFLKFGDLAAGDVTMNWDGSNFEIESAAAASNLLIGADSKVFNTTLKGTFTIGKDDTGHDVIFYGATAGSNLTWDESEDKLIITAGTADLGTSCEADAYTVGGAAGADFNGAVTNLTAVKGIVTAAS